MATPCGDLLLNATVETMVRARKGQRGLVIAVLAVATLVATTRGAGATYTSAFAPPAVSLAALGTSCATDKRLRVFPGSRAAAPAPAGARAARMMASAGGKGGKQRNGGGKRRDDAGDDKPDADRCALSVACLCPIDAYAVAAARVDSRVVQTRYVQVV